MVLEAQSTTKDYIRAEGDFHKEIGYVAENTTTNKAELRPKEQSEEAEKAESCWVNLWNEIQLKGPSRQKQTQEQNKKKNKKRGVGKLG